MTRYLRFLLLALTFVLTACSSTGNHQGFNKTPHKDVWERIRVGYQMPNLNDSRIDYWVDYYTRNPQSVRAMAERSSKYIYHVTAELEKRGMPTELALLPFVESAYNVNAYSRAKAAGLWQFIPSTGTHYKLNQNWWHDQRRDPVSSTNAALNYLSYLHDFQGQDWFLALASYNWGEGAVKRARDRNANSGLKTDYLSLKMPKETRDYVPKLLALKKIISNPSRYGVQLPQVDDVPYFEVVKTEQDIDVAMISRLSGVSEAEFKALNPSHHRQVILAQHQQHILLPKQNVQQFKTNLAKTKEPLSQWSGYVPNVGESMASIAQRHGISLERLKNLNGYKAGQNVSLSSRALLVPRNVDNPANSVKPENNASNSPDVMLASRDAAPNPSRIKESASSAPKKSNTAKPSEDPLAGLLASNDFKNKTEQSSSDNRSTAQARAVAHNTSSTTASPQSAAYQTNAAVKSKPNAVTHRVAAGETLYSLAKQYDTTVEDLSALNNLEDNGLQTGMLLRLPGSGVQG